MTERDKSKMETKHFPSLAAMGAGYLAVGISGYDFSLERKTNLAQRDLFPSYFFNLITQLRLLNQPNFTQLARRIENMSDDFKRLLVSYSGGDVVKLSLLVDFGVMAEDLGEPFLPSKNRLTAPTNVAAREWRGKVGRQLVKFWTDDLRGLASFVFLLGLYEEGLSFHELLEKVYLDQKERFPFLIAFKGLSFIHQSENCLLVDPVFGELLQIHYYSRLSRAQLAEYHSS